MIIIIYFYTVILFQIFVFNPNTLHAFICFKYSNLIQVITENNSMTYRWDPNMYDHSGSE